jgi:hypothetical protein
MYKRGVGALIVQSGDDTPGIVSECDLKKAICWLDQRALTMPAKDIAVTKIALRTENGSPRAMRATTRDPPRHLRVFANQRSVVCNGGAIKHRCKT